MSEPKDTRLDRINRYASMIEQQAGKAVRPFREDGMINMLNRYGTSKDSSEQYKFAPEPDVQDEILSLTYEGNGLFARIIDTPAEEAVKHGFTLSGVSDQAIEDFYSAALDELDWDETAMTAIKWARLFGGSIVVMLVNDGRGIDEPLDWKNIQSIDDLRVYDRSVIQPDYRSMFSYDPRDPFSTRGSRLGLPEYYYVTSRYGTFTVHESRCLVFQNGILPENCSNSIYQIWGMPEYIRIHRAMRDAEVAHGSAVKMLDRSVQPVYKMKDLATELSTDEGESRVLKRLQTIDMARGLLNSITVDSEGEDYDFKTFQFSGVSDVIDATCNYLSALTSIPQTILFGRSPAGMNATGTADLENYYNFVERIQKRMLRSNLRYLLSVIFQAGVSTGEVKEVPNINIKFMPLWSLSETEEADIALKKAQLQQVKASVAISYIQNQVLDPTEVRRKLADSEEFDIDTILDETDMEGEDLAAAFEAAALQEGTDPNDGGNAPAAAPNATKLPQDMPHNLSTAAGKEETPTRKQTTHQAKNPATEAAQVLQEAERKDAANSSVGVLVIKDGKVLTATRLSETGNGLICGPGGHVEPHESSIMAAVRETQEEFGILPKELIPIGKGPSEPETRLTPDLYLCTEYEGMPKADGMELKDARFCSMKELERLGASLFAPFADSLKVLADVLAKDRENSSVKPLDNSPVSAAITNVNNKKDEKNAGKGLPNTEESVIIANGDGGPGSGNHNHEGRTGQRGGSKHTLGSKERAKIAKRLVGQKTHDGIEIRSVSSHAFDKIGERKMSARRIETMMKTGDTSPGNRPHTRCYDIAGSRMVLDTQNGNIMTVMWRGGHRN